MPTDLSQLKTSMFCTATAPVTTTSKDGLVTTRLPIRFFHPDSPTDSSRAIKQSLGTKECEVEVFYYKKKEKANEQQQQQQQFQQFQPQFQQQQQQFQQQQFQQFQQPNQSPLASQFQNPLSSQQAGGMQPQGFGQMQQQQQQPHVFGAGNFNPSTGGSYMNFKTNGAGTTEKKEDGCWLVKVNIIDPDDIKGAFELHDGISDCMKAHAVALKIDPNVVSGNIRPVLSNGQHHNPDKSLRLSIPVNGLFKVNKGTKFVVVKPEMVNGKEELKEIPVPVENLNRKTFKGIVFFDVDNVFKAGNSGLPQVYTTKVFITGPIQEKSNIGIEDSEYLNKFFKQNTHIYQTILPSLPAQMLKETGSTPAPKTGEKSELPTSFPEGKFQNLPVENTSQQNNVYTPGGVPNTVTF